MSSGNSSEDSDALICIMCLMPRSLKVVGLCKHTFCVMCLGNYISGYGMGETFLCPRCKSSCTVPESGVNGFLDYDNSGDSDSSSSICEDLVRLFGDMEIDDDIGSSLDETSDKCESGSQNSDDIKGVDCGTLQMYERSTETEAAEVICTISQVISHLGVGKRCADECSESQNKVGPDFDGEIVDNESPVKACVQLGKASETFEKYNEDSACADREGHDRVDCNSPGSIDSHGCSTDECSLELDVSTFQGAYNNVANDDKLCEKWGNSDTIFSAEVLNDKYDTSKSAQHSAEVKSESASSETSDFLSDKYVTNEYDCFGVRLQKTTKVADEAQNVTSLTELNEKQATGHKCREASGTDSPELLLSCVGSNWLDVDATHDQVGQKEKVEELSVSFSFTKCEEGNETYEMSDTNLASARSGKGNRYAGNESINEGLICHLGTSRSSTDNCESFGDIKPGEKLLRSEKDAAVGLVDAEVSPTTKIPEKGIDIFKYDHMQIYDSGPVLCSEGRSRLDDNNVIGTPNLFLNTSERVGVKSMISNLVSSPGPSPSVSGSPTLDTLDSCKKSSLVLSESSILGMELPVTGKLRFAGCDSSTLASGAKCPPVKPGSSSFGTVTSTAEATSAGFGSTTIVTVASIIKTTPADFGSSAFGNAPSTTAETSSALLGCTTISTFALTTTEPSFRAFVSSTFCTETSTSTETTSPGLGSTAIGIVPSTTTKTSVSGFGPSAFGTVTSTTAITSSSLSGSSTIDIVASTNTKHSYPGFTPLAFGTATLTTAITSLALSESSTIDTVPSTTTKLSCSGFRPFAFGTATSTTADFGPSAFGIVASTAAKTSSSSLGCSTIRTVASTASKPSFSGFVSPTFGTVASTSAGFGSTGIGTVPSTTTKTIHSGFGPSPFGTATSTTAMTGSAILGSSRFGAVASTTTKPSSVGFGPSTVGSAALTTAKTNSARATSNTYFIDTSQGMNDSWFTANDSPITKADRGPKLTDTLPEIVDSGVRSSSMPTTLPVSGSVSIDTPTTGISEAKATSTVSTISDSKPTNTRVMTTVVESGSYHNPTALSIRGQVSTNPPSTTTNILCKTVGSRAGCSSTKIVPRQIRISRKPERIPFTFSQDTPSFTFSEQLSADRSALFIFTAEIPRSTQTSPCGKSIRKKKLFNDKHHPLLPDSAHSLKPPSDKELSTQTHWLYPSTDANSSKDLSNIKLPLLDSAGNNFSGKQLKAKNSGSLCITASSNISLNGLSRSKSNDDLSKGCNHNDKDASDDSCFLTGIGVLFARSKSACQLASLTDRNTSCDVISSSSLRRTRPSNNQEYSRKPLLSALNLPPKGLATLYFHSSDDARHVDKSNYFSKEDKRTIDKLNLMICDKKVKPYTSFSDATGLLSVKFLSLPKLETVKIKKNKVNNQTTRSEVVKKWQMLSVKKLEEFTISAASQGQLETFNSKEEGIGFDYLPDVQPPCASSFGERYHGNRYAEERKAEALEKRIRRDEAEYNSIHDAVEKEYQTARGLVQILETESQIASEIAGLLDQEDVVCTERAPSGDLKENSAIAVLELRAENARSSMRYDNTYSCITNANDIGCVLDQHACTGSKQPVDESGEGLSSEHCTHVYAVPKRELQVRHGLVRILEKESQIALELLKLLHQDTEECTEGADTGDQDECKMNRILEFGTENAGFDMNYDKTGSCDTDARDFECFFCQSENMKPGDSSAHTICEDCDDLLLCDRCVEVHRKTPATEKHYLVPINGVGRHSSGMCFIHKTRQKFLCQQCSIALCRICILNHNCQHEISSFTDLITESVDQLLSRMAECDMKLLDMKQGESMVELQKKTKLEWKAKVVEDIDDAFDNYMTTISNERDAMIKMLEGDLSTCSEDEYLATIKNQIDDIQTSLQRGEMMLSDVKANPSCVKKLSELDAKMHRILHVNSEQAPDDLAFDISSSHMYTFLLQNCPSPSIGSLTKGPLKFAKHDIDLELPPDKHCATIIGVRCLGEDGYAAVCRELVGTQMNISGCELKIDGLIDSLLIFDKKGKLVSDLGIPKTCAMDINPRDEVVLLCVSQPSNDNCIKVYSTEKGAWRTSKVFHLPAPLAMCVSPTGSCYILSEGGDGTRLISEVDNNGNTTQSICLFFPESIRDHSRIALVRNTLFTMGRKTVAEISTAGGRLTYKNPLIVGSGESKFIDISGTPIGNLYIIKPSLAGSITSYNIASGTKGNLILKKGTNQTHAIMKPWSHLHVRTDQLVLANSLRIAVFRLGVLPRISRLARQLRSFSNIPAHTPEIVLSTPMVHTSTSFTDSGSPVQGTTHVIPRISTIDSPLYATGMPEFLLPHCLNISYEERRHQWLLANQPPRTTGQ